MTSKVSDLTIKIPITSPEGERRFLECAEAFNSADALFGTLSGTFARAVREACEAEERDTLAKLVLRLDQDGFRAFEDTLRFGQHYGTRNPRARFVPKRRISELEAALLVESFDREHPELREMLSELNAKLDNA